MWIAIIILVILLNVFCIRLFIQNRKVPNLGHEAGVLTELSSKPNGVSSQTSFEKKKVAPLPYKSDTESTMKALVQAVEQYGNVKIVTQESNYLYLIFISELIKFKDDAEFYLNEETQKVHFRSASRAGTSDLGVNRKRYDAISEIYSTL